MNFKDIYTYVATYPNNSKEVPVSRENRWLLVKAPLVAEAWATAAMGQILFVRTQKRDEDYPLVN